jgi:asparaginyl-tRNA synthetase
LSAIGELGLKKEDYWWYLELRKYGSVNTRASGWALSA